MIKNENDKATEDLKKEKVALGLDDEADNDTEDESEEDESDDQESSEEESGSKKKKDEEDESEEEDKKTEEEESDEEESEEDDDSEEDESDDEDESDEEDDDEESDEDSEEESPTGKKHIPIAKLKRVKDKFRNKEKGYLDKISDLQTKLDEKEKTTDKDEQEQIDDEVKNLAKELELDDPSVLQRIINVARKGNKSEISPELAKTLEAFQKSQSQQDEVAHFNKEWTATLPRVKEMFPTAKEDHLEAAQKLMDKLSHSKEWVKYDLDYILFKNKSKFEGLLHVPKKKGFEKSSHGFDGNESEKRTDNGRLVPENATKADIDRAEKRLNELASGGTLIRGPKTRSLK